MSKRLLTEREVHDIYGLNIGTLQNLRISGAPFPFVKHGNSIFYKESVIDEYIEQNSWRSTTEYQAKQTNRR